MAGEAVRKSNRTVSNKLALTAGVLLGAVSGWCGPAAAWTGQVVWPTYARSGPGAQYAVVDELLRGTPLEVVGCDDQWCQVRWERAGGYVDRAALATPQAAVPPLKPPADTAAGCFDARRAGYGRGEEWRYCPR